MLKINAESCLELQDIIAGSQPLPGRERHKKTGNGRFICAFANQRNDGPLNPIHIAKCSATLAPSFFEKRSNGDS